jgi:hypothetical protein
LALLDRGVEMWSALTRLWCALRACALALLIALAGWLRA